MEQNKEAAMNVSFGSDPSLRQGCSHPLIWIAQTGQQKTLDCGGNGTVTWIGFYVAPFCFGLALFY
jgi:hypothetical protein